MKKTVFLLMVLAMLSVGAAEAQTCPTVTGPHFWAGQSWYDYAIAPGCYNTSNASQTTSSCGYGAWSFGDAGAATFSFTATSVATSTNWKAVTRIYFNDPNNSAANWVYFDVIVTHNGTPTTYQYVSWSGTDGDITGCALSSGTFTAVAGDNIEVRIFTAVGVTSSGTPTITVEYPSITSNS